MAAGKKPKKKYKPMDPMRIARAMTGIYNGAMTHVQNSTPISAQTVQEVCNIISVHLEVARGQYASHNTWKEITHPVTAIYRVAANHYSETTVAPIRDTVDKLVKFYELNKSRQAVDRDWRINPDLRESIYAVRDAAKELLREPAYVELVQEMDRVTGWMGRNFPPLEN